MIEGNDFKLEYLPEHSKFDLYLLKTINAKNADKKSPRAIGDDQVHDLFGV